MAVSKKRRRGRSSEGVGWRRSPVTGFVALLVIVFCLYNIFFSSHSASSAFKNDYVCRECRKDFRLPFSEHKGKAPYVCPDCSKQALYTALHCNGCGNVTASLEPLRAFTCTSCGYHENARLDANEVPFDCPKCSKKTFYETYECMSCKYVFGYKKENLAPAERQDMMGEFREMATCPKCGKTNAYHFLEPVATCEFCKSSELSSITPVSVIKWELGRELKPNEKKEVEEWQKSHP